MTLQSVLLSPVPQFSHQQNWGAGLAVVIYIEVYQRVSTKSQNALKILSPALQAISKFNPLYQVL